MTGRVVVIGDLVTDVLAVVDGRGGGRPADGAGPGIAGRLVEGSDTPARIRVAGGGQAANTAAWLARCGVPVTLVAVVGDDPAGHERLAELAAAGVDCAVRHAAGVPTGTLVVLSAGTDRSMVTDRGAAGELCPADVDAALDRSGDARHLHLSGYALLGEQSRPAGQHALAAARGRGLSTSVDAASVAPLRRAGAAAFLDWVRGVDLLLANAAEAGLLGATLPGAALPGPPPDTDPAGHARALADVAGAAVVTLGPAGACWAGSGGTAARVEAVPASPVDPTGAGDAFAAGLLAAWLAGADPAGALRAGARLGAEAVTIVGARPDPSYSEGGRSGPAICPRSG